jgi:hypothetical protein
LVFFSRSTIGRGFGCALAVFGSKIGWIAELKTAFDSAITQALLAASSIHDN